MNLKGMIKIILLQCKFLLVAFLNLTYNLVPNPLRNYYLRLFGIKIHSGSVIHRYCKFFHVGKLTIGKNSVVNFGCYLDNRRGIRIGNNVGLAHNVKIYTLGHDIDDPMFRTKGKPVVLEDGVFVFANVLIMPGVTLHKNCVILPGSVVTKDIDANAVAGGNPARILRYRTVDTPPPILSLLVCPLMEKIEMSILFILKTFDIGGVEVVTSVLANKFVAEGYHVSIFAFASSEHSIESRLDKRVRLYVLRNLVCSEENVYSMRAVMLEEHVHIVINQWGLPVVPIRVAQKAAKGLNVKFISVYHNSPDKNGRLQSVDIELAHATSTFKYLYLKCKRWAFHAITSWGMRYNYKHSDLYMVLSPSFVDKFKDFTGIRNPKHLVVQTNPVTIDVKGYSYNPTEKKKEILFVGRLDFIQKRVSRVLDTWHLLEKNYPDWRLTIVGDGEERGNLELQAHALGLKRVSFEGFQSPVSYYKRASVLVLTSEFEGFPLVLAEAMSFGVIPVVYDSFSAVRDIIEQSKDGIIVPKVNDAFSAEKMAKGIESAIKNMEETHEGALAAIEKSKQYSLENIVNQWTGCFERLKK